MFVRHHWNADFISGVKGKIKEMQDTPERLPKVEIQVVLYFSC